MSLRVIVGDVGYLVIDGNQDGLHKFHIEQDFCSNTFGDVGQCYKNSKARDTGGVYYMAEVPGGVIDSSDPSFSDYAYSYKDILRICNEDSSIADYVFELAIGQPIEVIYEEIKE